MQKTHEGRKTMSEEYKRICDFLKKENIDCFALLSADAVSVINARLMPSWAKSVVVFIIPYYTGEYFCRNVSLYAVSRDYHLYIKELEARFDSKGKNYKFFADTSPIDERKAALDAGLGLWGQNRLLINEKYGSYVFIGSIITDVVFDDEEYVAKAQPKECKRCGLCKKVCAFLRGEREYCLSELNQRKRVTDEELMVIRSKKIIWGCDDCQSVCPCNKDVPITPIEFFHFDKRASISKESIQNMSDKDFSQRAYSWRGKAVLLRNLSNDGEQND